jgi:hypothetical protein
MTLDELKVGRGGRRLLMPDLSFGRMPLLPPAHIDKKEPKETLNVRKTCMKTINTSIPDRIMRRARASGRGSIFTPGDFLDPAGRATLD